MPSGPQFEPALTDAEILPSTTSPLQTVAGLDTAISTLFTCGVAHRIFCCTAGTLAIKRENDAAFVPYPVNVGQYIDGKIVAVGGSGSGSTAGVQWIAEV